jgi:hypothetical protein
MRKKVLQLIGSFGQGGSERQALQLTRLLRDEGSCDVRLACLDPGGPLRPEAEELGLGEIAAYPLRSFYDGVFVSQLARLVRYLRREHIEILQTHDFYTNVFGLTAAAIAGTPLRIGARRETTGVRGPAQQHVERTAYRTAHAIVANSEAVRQQLMSEGVADVRS